MTDADLKTTDLNTDQIETMLRERVASADAQIVALRAEKARIQDRIKVLAAESDKARRMLPRTRTTHE